MWSLARHIHALLLSITLITTLIKFKQYHDRENYGHLDVVNETESDNFTMENHYQKRRKYRNFILGNRSAVSDNGVYILGLFELSTKFGIREDGFSEIEAAQLAVEHVNAKNVLLGHQLKLLINDTQCDPGAGIDRFFHALYSKKTIVMLLGSGCSNVTESLANIVPYWNILQVSFGSTSPTLSDGNKFPLFFRTITPDSSHNAAKSAFIRKYKWNTVATFSQRENTYLLPLNNLVAQLERANVSCAATVTFSTDNFKEQLQYLKELDIRIIIGSFSHEIAPHIFCEVYKLKMYGADYVWIMQHHGSIWWKDHYPVENCGRIALKESTEGAIFLAHHNAIPENRVSISGLTNEQFESGFNSSRMSRHVRQTYDAVWAMGLALRDVAGIYGYNLSEFYYDNDDFVEKLVGRMREMRFMGVSGPVFFQGADRIGNTVIKQIQGGRLKDVAIYYPNEGQLNFKCRTCTAVRWRGNRVPIAKRILKTNLLTIPRVAFFIVSTVAVMGIVTCFCCLLFNFHFRKMKVVKLSSPRLNNIAVFGCILVYVAVILLGMDAEIIFNVDYFAQLCSVRVYFLSAGFSLAFGSMFAKTYRVHRIFTYSCTSIVKDKILKDKQLISLILLLLIIDGIIVSFWVYIDPLQRGLYNLSMEISSDDRSVLYQRQVEVCICNNTTGWFIAIYGYKGFLLIMGVYMAWETRHIKVEALNDSQYIGICVYSAVFSSIVVLLSNFLTEYTTLAYLARTVSILLSATLTLLLLFVPKLKSVYWDRERDPIMQSMGLKIECNTRRFIGEDPRELTYRMEVQNKVYRCELAALDQEIARLKELLHGKPSVMASTRASWPSTSIYRARNFCSENAISEDDSIKFGERLEIFDRLKQFFGRIPSVWLHFSNNAVITGDDNLVSGRGNSKSMNVVYANRDFDARPFFISVDDNQFKT